MPSQSALALRLATSSGDEAGRTIRELLEFELSAAPGRGLVQWDVSSDGEAATLKLGAADGMQVSKGQALRALQAGGLVLGEALASWHPELAESVGVGLEDAWLQRDAIESARPRISFLPADVVATPELERARQALEHHGHVALVGSSSSGKTVIADVLREEEGLARSTWIDLADPTVGLLGFVMAICRKSLIGGRGMLVLDDLQSAPALGRAILRLTNDIGLLQQPGVHVIVVSWPDGLEMVQQWFGDEAIVRSNGNDACRRIIALSGAAAGDTQHLLGLANGDALIAELGSEFFRSHGRVPNREELAAECFETVVGGQSLSHEELESLWEIACLGIFEIDARLDLIAQVSQASLDGLVQKRVLRRKGDFIFFGHRSAARLVAHYMQDHINEDADRSPIRLAVRYLRRAGGLQIKQTLDRLDLVSVANEEDQFGAAFLAHCWTSVKILVSHLRAMVREDPTWGDNVGSAIFAAEALAELGLEAEWLVVANYIRSRWTLDSSENLPQYDGDRPAEADDFRQISGRMAEEDLIDPAAFDMTAAEVDVDRFHRTWVLGLLLGFEARALVVDRHRIKELRRMAAESQLPNGSFYPSRVPWVTDRVCLGISAFGDTVATNPVLRQASEWLRRRAPDGPFSFGSWRSGTGTWNTDMQTTAMTLLALGRMGVEPSDSGVRSSLAYLKDGRDDWFRPGKEIDCAQAIEATLVLGGTWRDFATELRSLLAWAQDSSAWAGARTLASVAQDESVKVPEVAGALISIIWETVKAELPLLFQRVVDDLGAAARQQRLSADQHEAIMRQLRHIGEAIAQSIRERNTIGAKGRLPDVVAERLRELTIYEEQYEALMSEVGVARDETGSSSVVDLVTRINTLGAAVLGAAWPGVSVS